jgi:hypothetical protein
VISDDTYDPDALLRDPFDEPAIESPACPVCEEPMILKGLRRIARLLVRGADKKDGIIIGVAFKGSRDVLKSGTIYELREVLGGDNAGGGRPGPVRRYPEVSRIWVDLSRLVEENMFYLTKAEWRETCKRADAGDKKTITALKRHRK